MIVFDGNSILNRAFYGVRPLNTKDGFPTNALFGFVNILLKNLTDDGRAAVAFDLHEPTFRHKASADYKANRKGMPEDLAKQMPVAKEILKKLGIAVLECPGYEADDIIGTVARLSTEAGEECYIVTGDRDSYQLVRDHVTVRLAANNETRIITPAALQEQYGLNPQQMIDLKAIMGDSSDNISGVPGIGEKGALALMHEYGSLDNIYLHLDEIKGAAQKKLTEGKEAAEMSRFLAEINVHAPVPSDLSVCDRKPRDDDGLIELLNSLEFSSLISRLDLRHHTIVQAEIPLGEISASEMLSRVTDGVSVHLENSVLWLFDGALWRCPFDAESAAIFSGEAKLTLWSVKETARQVLDAGYSYAVQADDVSLLAYLVSPADNGLTIEKAAATYCGLDQVTCVAALLPALKKALDAKLDEGDGRYLYHEIELPLAVVLAKMEHDGFLVDRTGLLAYSQAMDARLSQEEERIYSLAGHTFNINSPKQLGTVLFEELHLPHFKKNKSGYSTDVEVLEKLADYHPIVASILEQRKLAKLKSTYCDGLLKVISSDGRVHTTFRQTLTKTGRLSSVEPNLQNIPVRTELGRELRRFFIAPEGYRLIDADYSQIELRLLAHVSGDVNLLEAFRNGADIHTATASQVFGVPPASVTPELRKRAKAVNFGIVYGISAFSLANDIGVSTKHAAEYIASYFAAYPQVQAYLEQVKADAKRDGYVTTMYGRRRYIPELASSKKNMVSFGERVAMNTPIQGAAADIIKKAMVDTAKALAAEKLDARIVLQVHDELIVEASETDAERARDVLVRCMETVFPLSVPLAVDAHIGLNWLEAK